MAMKRNYLLLSIIIALALMLLTNNFAQAYEEEAPFDYAIITADKEYILVMLIPDEEIIWAWRNWSFAEPIDWGTAIFDIEIPSDGVGFSRQATFWLRSKYPCSGLYKNDGSITPIWTMDSYGFVYLLDEEYLILPGPWDSIELSPEDTSALDGLAVAFYKNGNVLASYSVSDLVKDKDAIPLSASHYNWREEEFDRDTGLLSIETVDHQKYTFDIREMGRNVEGKNVKCTPNYRFGKTGPFTEPPEIATKAESTPTPNWTETVPGVVRNKYPVILVVVITIILIVGSAILIQINRKRHR